MTQSKRVRGAKSESIFVKTALELIPLSIHARRRMTSNLLHRNSLIISRKAWHLRLSHPGGAGNAVRPRSETSSLHTSRGDISFARRALPPQPWVARYSSLPREEMPTTKTTLDSDEYIAIQGYGGNAFQAKRMTISIRNRVVCNDEVSDRGREDIITLGRVWRRVLQRPCRCLCTWGTSCSRGSSGLGRLEASWHRRIRGRVR